MFFIRYTRKIDTHKPFDSRRCFTKHCIVQNLVVCVHKTLHSAAFGCILLKKYDLKLAPCMKTLFYYFEAINKIDLFIIRLDCSLNIYLMNKMEMYDNT